MTAAVALFAGLAVLLALPRPADLRDVSPNYSRLLLASQVAASGVGAFALVRMNLPPLLGVVLIGTVAGIARAARRRGVRRAAARRRDLVLATCEGLAADLAAGLAPYRALRTAHEGWSEFQPVADAAAIGADVPNAFRAMSELPGAGMLRVAASAWGVAGRSGASLAEAIAFAADAIRAERETARVVAAELAAALATARLLALLPLGILVLGRGMGGDPFGFLIGTTPGQVCLAAGIGIGWIGTVWLERIVDQVEQP